MFLFSSLLIFALVESTTPCSCISLSIDVDFAQTSTIFIGRVLHTNIKDSDSIFGYAEMTMDVQEAIKGTKAGDKILVRSDLEKLLCGRGSIPVGSQWQIWLKTGNSIHLCSRTTHDAYKDIDILRNLALRERIYENQSDKQTVLNETNPENIHDENSDDDYDYYGIQEKEVKESGSSEHQELNPTEQINILTHNNYMDRSQQNNYNVNMGSILKIDFLFKIFWLILYFLSSL
ncbi:hypothetical protein I4U23_022190 [Adineta vaga]|nr:hypothetical protein I4U23_022190 [Adineta vaga]